MEKEVDVLNEMLKTLKEMHEDMHRELREIKVRLMEINR